VFCFVLFGPGVRLLGSGCCFFVKLMVFGFGRLVFGWS